MLARCVSFLLVIGIATHLYTVGNSAFLSCAPIDRNAQNAINQWQATETSMRP